MAKIIQEGHSTLRSTSEEIPIKEIATPVIQKVLKKMKVAIRGEKNAVAIAAPQIGESLRIFIVSGKAFTNGEDENAPSLPDLTFINPKLIKVSKEKKWMDEGCLSVRGKYGKVKRSKKATVRAYNESGKRFQRGGSGLLAQIFQHEIDHLNGTLFTDKAKELQDVKPQKENE